MCVSRLSGDESLRLLCYLILVFKPGTFPKTKAKRGGKDHKTTRIQTEHKPSAHNMHAERGIWFPRHTRVDRPLSQLSFWKKGIPLPWAESHTPTGVYNPLGYTQEARGTDTTTDVRPFPLLPHPNLFQDSEAKMTEVLLSTPDLSPEKLHRLSKGLKESSSETSPCRRIT